MSSPNQPIWVAMLIGNINTQHPVYSQDFGIFFENYQSMVNLWSSTKTESFDGSGHFAGKQFKDFPLSIHSVGDEHHYLMATLL